MILNAILLALAPASPAITPTSDLLAIRVGRAETASQGSLEHAVILIEGGKIQAIGQDLPIGRGIPILDRPDWVVMPGLINGYSRSGLESRANGGNNPEILASTELYPGHDSYEKLLELGVTTLGLYPPGSGIPGQAVAVRSSGDSVQEMILRDKVYLKIRLASTQSSKKALRDGFESVDKHKEKEEKNREKWDKAQEKAKKKKKDDKDSKSDKKEKEVYEPLEIDPDVRPFMDLRDGSLRALISIRKAGDYLHLLDAIGEEEFTWSLRVPLFDDSDLYEVAERIGESQLQVVVEPRLTTHPFTRRLRNLPEELARAGAKLVFIPSSDSITGHKTWLTDVGHLVSLGLDRQAAIRAMTIEPATLLGLEEQLGSLDVGKQANLIFFDGEPFEASTRIQAVMLEGQIVSGEVNR